MNRLEKYISSQFKNPRGLGGIVISLIQNLVNRAMYRKTVDLVELKPDERLLDIGYGNGHLLSLIYRKTSADLYGIDISEDAKQMATRKNKKADAAQKLHLSVGDCCSLPYEDNTFASITSINTIYFWSDPVKGLSEIRRTLIPGRAFYNVIYTREYLNTIKYTQIGYQKYTPDELVQFGRQANYSSVEVKDIVKGRSMVVIYTK